MDNFSIFKDDNLKLAIEPFLPGATEHVTPIAYHAWTPDVFLFLFRLMINGEDHFFASVVFDHLSRGQETAEDILQRWHGLTVNGFLYPPKESDAKVDPKDDGLFLDQMYKAYLVEVQRPKELGYWSNYVEVTKDTDLSDMSLGLSEDALDGVKKLLAQNEDYVISVYENEVGEAEYFYNV